MDNQNKYYAHFACGDFNIIKKELDDDSFFIAKGYIDNYKNEKDPLIGFYPKIVLKNRLNINLIYFDEYMRKSCESYFYYKTFKTKVAGGFYASDEINIFENYLYNINELDNTPPYVVVTYPHNFESVYNICVYYRYIKEIILLSNEPHYFRHYFQSHSFLLKYIASSYDDLMYYLQKMGDMVSPWKYRFRFFFRNRIFTYDDIQMKRQLSYCPIITAYEYDELYFIVHRAFAHFFDGEYAEFGDLNLQKVKEFINESKCDLLNDQARKELNLKFEELNKSENNFLKEAIKKYTEESYFYKVLNQVMRVFDEKLYKLAYFIGPFMLALNQHLSKYPEKGLNQDTTLFRTIYIDPLEKYDYTLSEGHIICFPSFTSTSVIRNNFIPTNKKPNSIKIELFIQYKYRPGNISPAIDISDMSVYKQENERLLLPFTFLRINSIAKDPYENYIIYMEIINRKSVIEYKLKEEKKYNIEDLEQLYDGQNPLFIEQLVDKSYNNNNRWCLII
jgi:hypothetical protein